MSTFKSRAAYSVDRFGCVLEESYAPHLWRRFLARVFDYSLWLSLIGLIGLPFGHWDEIYPLPIIPIRFVPWEFFVWMPIEMFFLIAWGKTPAKWFLKIEIRQGKRRKLSWFTACKRSFSVWLYGLGMMIPWICCICMGIASYRLLYVNKTSWDRDEGISIVFLPIGTWRWIIASIFSAIIFLVFFY